MAANNAKTFLRYLGLFIIISAYNASTAAMKANTSSNQSLRIGWAAADITPDQPVLIAGQFHARVSEGVMDPITATALALESTPANVRLVMVSCDLFTLDNTVRDSVRDLLRHKLPELNPESMLLFATHIHSGPLTTVNPPYRPNPAPARPPYGVKLDAMDPAAYVAWASARIADAITQAWRGRAPGGIAYGLTQAVVGHNRLIAYTSGRSRIYGATDRTDFSHVEGYEDHSLNLLCTYDTNKKLTGMIVNLACPAQVDEHSSKISADFWHDTRVELRRRLDKQLFILPQCSAAGDQSPHVLLKRAAQAHMQRLMKRNRRQDIAMRIAGGVTDILPFIEKEIDFNPPLRHRVETVKLPRPVISEQTLADSAADAAQNRQTYEDLQRKLKADPKKRNQWRWYYAITRNFSRMRWHEQVGERFKLQQTNPILPIEVHVIRLGDVAFTSNPFEFYLDYGIQIQERSPATQTFVIQLAGPGAFLYLPTERSVAGGTYGAVPASMEVGPESGRQLVAGTVEAIKKLWPQIGDVKNKRR